MPRTKDEELRTNRQVFTEQKNTFTFSKHQLLIQSEPTLIGSHSFRRWRQRITAPTIACAALRRGKTDCHTHSITFFSFSSPRSESLVSGFSFFLSTDGFHAVSPRAPASWSTHICVPFILKKNCSSGSFLAVSFSSGSLEPFVQPASSTDKATSVVELIPETPASPHERNL